MRPPLAEQLDHFARRFVPFAITMLLVLLGAIWLPVPRINVIAPSFALMAIFYWTIHRADLMPAAGVFALGLLQDILEGTPLGLSALMLLLVFALLRSQRRYLYDRPFIVQWAGFALVAAVVGIGTWLTMSVLMTTLIDVWPTLFQFAMSLVLYPCIAWLMMRAQHAFLRQV